VFSMGSVPRGYKGAKKVAWSRKVVEGIGSSSGDGGRRQLRRNGNKGSKTLTEDLRCDLK
jgi:hypothetical protein